MFLYLLSQIVFEQVQEFAASKFSSLFFQYTLKWNSVENFYDLGGR